ncbi:hypothetical protein DRQ29_00355 [bacterium]|nr:MAG: hypothetical protein DRQ29_00355 [bacterium]
MLKEAFRTLGEKIGNLFSKTVDYTTEKTFDTFVKDEKRREEILHTIQDEAFVKSINPEVFRTEYYRQKVKEIKEKAKQHNTSITDWIDSFVLPFLGKATPDVIFESIGIDKKKLPDSLKNFIGLMDTISDLSIITGYIDVISTATSFTLLRKMGDFIDRIVDYSGLRTVTGYGFGTAFGSAIAPIMAYTINEQLLPMKPDLRFIFDGFGRFKITPTAFKKHLKYYGINPDEKLDLPEDEVKLGYGVWYDNKSIIENFMHPEKWKEVRIETYGDLMMRLAESPVSYFILRQVAESGFYDRELFKRALVDSSYSPLAMALILLGCEKAFIRRHMTKYEDELNDMYLNGELTFEEYKEAMKDIYPTEDMVNVITGFFKNKWIRTRRVGVKSLVEHLYKKGVLSKEDAKIRLLNSGYRAWIVDDLITLWDMEKKIGKDFTETQLCRIAKEGIWTLDKVFDRLVKKGWDIDEAEAWLKLYLPKDRWNEIEETVRRYGS